MTVEDAAELIRGMCVTTRGMWADFGSGDGTFTLALATILKRASTIHAIDRDAAALKHIPSEYTGTTIVTHHGDFTKQPWPLGPLDGALLANSLHDVSDQEAFIRACGQAMNQPHRFLIVEYDTDRSNPWVPYRSASAASSSGSAALATRSRASAHALRSINEHRSTRR